ncbi:hypothetical protein TNCV_1893991 [Trichonephila clavipes]|nr:hypothetical protein TNCV_1893991 [Trichonephila clavipes]
MRFSFPAPRCKLKLFLLPSSLQVQFMGEGALESSSIIRQNFGISDSRSPPRSTPEMHFSRTKTLSPCLGLRKIWSLGIIGKVTGISGIGYQIQIVRFKISQGPSFRISRLLR